MKIFERLRKNYQINQNLEKRNILMNVNADILCEMWGTEAS